MPLSLGYVGCSIIIYESRYASGDISDSLQLAKVIE